MTPKQEFKLAYALAGILLVVGIFSYAAYSAEPPEEPLRIMYQTVAGKVLFDHKAHFSAEHFGIDCQDCHHHPHQKKSRYPHDDPNMRACVDCHQVVEEEPGVPETCFQCHGIDNVEGTKMSKSSDAAHGQCIGCHDEYEAGPVDCNGCHVL